jgi:hypothetical protein
MAYTPPNPNGNTTASASSPVTLASDNNGPVKVWDGTNTAAVLAPGTANSGGNAVLSAPVSQTASFSYTAITAGTTYDVGNYSWVSLHVTSQYVTSIVTPQVSNDGTNWVGIALTLSSTTSGVAPVVNTASSGVILHGPLAARYFRINVTGAYTSGTCAGTIVFSGQPKVLSSVPSASSLINFSAATGQITTSSTSVAATFLAGVATIGGFAIVTIHGTHAGISFGITVSDDLGTTYYPVSIFDSSAQAWLAPGATITPGTNASKAYWVPIPPGSAGVKVLASAYTSGTGTIRISGALTGAPGSTQAQLMDAAGNSRGVNVTAANQLATQKAQLNAPVAVSSSATVVKGSAGFLSGVLVTTAGTSTAMNIYDNASAASGTIIGIVPATAVAGQYCPFDMPATAGITCSGSATNPAVTVAYS